MDSPFSPDRFTVLDIAPFSPGSEERLAREMVEYRDRTGENIVLYCLSFHPEGRPALAKAEFLVGSYRKLSRALEGSGIRVGVPSICCRGGLEKILYRTVQNWGR